MQIPPVVHTSFVSSINAEIIYGIYGISTATQNGVSAEIWPGAPLFSTLAEVEFTHG
jgi:hypothetical protein